MPPKDGLLHYHDTVRAEWVDYNGHLRDAYYMLIFSIAGDLLIDEIGLTANERASRHRSVYTLEAHVRYVREVKEGAQLDVTMRVLAMDAKRLHVYFEMFVDGGAEPRCASEQIWLHVDTTVPRGVAFDADVAGRVAAFHEAQRALEPARHAGRAIALRT